jgi:serine/threonine protein kinase
MKYKKYDYKIDVWSIGCVFAEFFVQGVLFKSTYIIYLRGQRTFAFRENILNLWGL